MADQITAIKRIENIKIRSENMTREFLQNLGLQDSVIDSILQENTQDIEKEKQETEMAKNDLAGVRRELTAAQEELEKSKKSGGDSAGIQRQFDELRTKYDTDIGDLRKQLEERDYSDAIAKAVSGAGLKFSSKAAERDFVSRLREEKFELKDGRLSIPDGYIKAQKEADPDAFASDKPVPHFVTPAGGSGEPAPRKTTAEQIAETIGKARAESNQAAENVISRYTGGKI